MGTLRFIIRFSLFWGWTAIMAGCGIIAGGKSWKGIKRLTNVARIWNSVSARIFGLDIKIFGNPGECCGLILSNHVSYVDIILLGAVFPLRYTPKSEIKYWPVLGQILWLSRPIWVERSTKHSAGKTLMEISESLHHNINIIAFPEGTTTDGKGELLPFKSTVFEAVINTQAQFHPVLIHYKEDDKTRVSWYGDDTLIAHARKLLKSKKIEAEVHILPPISANGRNRKQLAEDTYAVMNDKYKELYGVKDKG